MRTEIMENSLGLLDQKLRLEGSKVILFLDNAPCYPKKLQNNLANKKLIFLPKYTPSRLQPRDVYIIRALKCKYRKLFMKYVVSRIDEGKKAFEIIQDVNIAKSIHWLQVTWKDMLIDAIVNYFQKCGYKKSKASSSCKDNEIDEEFATLLNQLRDDNDITGEDFITFHDNITTSIG